MIRAINSFQLTALFCGMPYLIEWLDTGPFPHAGFAFFAAIPLYVVLFNLHWLAVHDYFKKSK